MQPLFWAGDEPACAFYRCHEPARALRRLGRDVRASDTFTIDELASADVVVGQRIYSPEASDAWQRLAGHVPLVFDIDDDLWHLPLDHPARPRLGLDGHARLSANVAAADLVTVSTDALAEIVRRLTSSPVIVVPNALPSEAFDLPLVDPRPDVVRIGYAGSPSHARDLLPLRGVARRLQRRYGSRIEWHAHGLDVGAILGVPAVHHPWRPDVLDHVLWLDFDIGLAPLRSDAFNASKSPVKVIEYAARGIPTIAANVGPYPAAITHGADGFLAATPADFEAALVYLIEEPDARLALGKAAHDRAAAITTDHTALRWADALTLEPPR